LRNPERFSAKGAFVTDTASAITTTAPAPVAGPSAPAKAVTPVAAVTNWLNQWRYDGGTRDLRFDFLRGFAVIAMVTDHIGGEHSWLYLLTGGNKFFVSAAEAFVFISGLVFGIVEVSLINRQGMDAALTKAIRRVFTLYIFTTGLTLAFALFSGVLRLPWAPKAGPGGWPDWVLSVLTLHRAYYLTDVLLLHVLLVLVSAFALLLMQHRYTWLVLTLSWGLWALWQWSPQYAAFPWEIQDNSVFHFPAWQVLFINGLVIGFHRKAITRWLSGRVSVWVLLVGTGLLFAGSVLLYRTNLAPLVRLTGRDVAWLGSHLFEKDNVRIGRLIVFAVFMTFIFSLTTVLWQPLRRAFGWMLLPLGSHALGAYCTHLFVVGAVTKLLAVAPSRFNEQATAPVTTLVQSGGIAIVWAVIALREPLFRFWHKLRPRHAATATATATTEA